MNHKVTSKSMGRTAANILNNDSSSNIQRQLAGSVLSQRNPHNQTGANMEDIAAKVLNSDKYSSETKSLAACLVSQSDKNR